MDPRPTLALVAAAAADREWILVGIGGHGAAGKTTLARMIPDAQIVSTDEFWDGEGFDITRLASEVIEPLSHGRAAHFASYDWAARAPRGSRTLEPKGVVVIEGVCALHRRLRDALAVRIWVDAPVGVRLSRAIERDGEEARSTWMDVWIPSEERYVLEDDPVGCADLVVDGGRGLGVEARRALAAAANVSRGLPRGEPAGAPVPQGPAETGARRPRRRESPRGSTTT
jgi:cytidylate kinase